MVDVRSPVRAAMAVPIALPIPKSSSGVEYGRIERQTMNPPRVCQATSRVRRRDVMGGTPVAQSIMAKKTLGGMA